MPSYYVDACIYLNLWQKERGNLFGKPCWPLAKNFLDKAINSKSIIYYSGFLLKEMKFILSEKEFENKVKIFSYHANFIKLGLIDGEFQFARRIERKIKYKIGFYDIIHMILARRTNSILITRDKNLIKISKKFGVIAKKPEEIIH